ncbi:mitochondrial import receptor subunit TOM22 [Paragonimus westermani]|uniref:Mitochondrial import receptor subunit TOM22 homolog n=1 Tax=Paragonimus westermani TaxID=34504 RepID=A0A5J4NHK9_9TREM|nr:mitochondrial import receptor subunit TOM22 [Paragonimus westermani]
MDSEEVAVEVLPPPPYSETDNSIEKRKDADPLITSTKDPTKTVRPHKDFDMEIAHRSRAFEETGDAASDLDEDFEDETVVERLIGLTEMFPESFRNGCSSAFKMALSGISTTFDMSKNVSWFLASTATICFLPLFLELERAQTEEQEAVHQRTMMLGPRAASGGSTLAGFSSNVPHLSPM